jgi:thioredoxin 2
MNQETTIVSCSRCGTKNRVPVHRWKDQPVCGKCGASLLSGGPGKPVDVTDQSFSAEVLSYPGAVLVDCWAPWCGPCRTLGPVLEELAGKYAGRVKIAKLNVDENPATAQRYGIRSIPTMIFFQNGSKVSTLVGAQPKQEIERRLQPLL